MTNTMPMLTDDGQELARKVWEELDRSACPGAFMHIAYESVMRHYAKPAFTAEPVYQFIVNNPDHDGYIEWADCNADFYNKEPADKRRILYTAPPEPALKPIELPKKETIREPGIVFDVFHVKEVINAIRQAGYEVKE